MIIESKNNKINREILERNKNYLIQTWKKYLTFAYILFFLGVFMFCIFQNTFKMKIYAFISLMVVIIFILTYKIIMKKNIDLILTKQMEAFGKDEILYSLIFEENSVYMILFDNNRHCIKYESINKVIETETEILLFINVGSFIICQKNNLVGDNKAKIQEMLTRTGVKWVNRK